MVFRHKPPIATVQGVVAIVTLHPIVVEFESVFRGFLAIDEYLAVTDL
jgi:hypothetical protein